MKIFFLSSFLLLTVFNTITFAQSKDALNGFKYAVVAPLVYKNNQRDIYGIETKAISGLQSAGLIYLNPTDRNKWPEDAVIEPCKVIIIQFSEGRLPNSLNCGSIRVVGIDCKGQVVFDENQRAKNAICSYPYDCCWRKWANAAEEFFGEFKYKYDQTKNSLKTEYPEVESVNETEESLKSYFTNNKIDMIEGIYKSYQVQGLPYYKFAIKKYDDKYKAIILEAEYKIWKAGEVKAYLEPSSMAGFYSIKWYRGNKTSIETFGGLENAGLLNIELTDQVTKEKRQDKFIKMFPPASNDGTFTKQGVKTTGSGFFISTDGYIATNAHVIEGAKTISVSVSNEIGTFKYAAKVVLTDSKNDVALLQITDSKFKGLTVIPYSIIEKADVGEKVFTIGYPLNDIMGNNYKVTDGIISAKSGIADDIRFYQISVPLQPGNSGGPLFNNQGSIIGLTTSRLNSKAVGTQIENVNYAIKSSYLLTLYNMLPNSTALPNNSSLTEKDLKDQVKVLKNYVCLIETE